MAPIRIGLIGLSQTAQTSWAAAGHLPYLLSEHGRQRYQIVALLNSSEDAAKRAIEYYNLPKDTKAYGSAAALAADPNVDLVVCSTRVDKHYDGVLPSIQAGKTVFVEWPVAENSVRAQELLAAAKKSGSTTLVGLQSRTAPVLAKIRELLEAGLIGEVLSSEATMHAPFAYSNSVSEGLSYFLDKKVGGNLITIMFAHTFDYIASVLGEYSTSHALTQIQKPLQQITPETVGLGGTITTTSDTPTQRTMRSDVPDYLSLHGTLQPSPIVTHSGASLTVSFRAGSAFPGTQNFHWTIYGSTGALRLSSTTSNLQSGSPVKLEHWDYSAEGDDPQTRVIDWEWEKTWQEALPARAKNVGMVYDLFAEGERPGLSGGVLVGLEEAVARHEMLDRILWPEGVGSSSSL